MRDEAVAPRVRTARQASPSAIANCVSTPWRHVPASRLVRVSKASCLASSPKEATSFYKSASAPTPIASLRMTRGKTMRRSCEWQRRAQPVPRRGRCARVPRRHRDRAECGGLFNLYLPGPRQLGCCETRTCSPPTGRHGIDQPRPWDYRPRSGPTAPMVPIHDRIPVTPEPANQLRFGSTARCSAQRVRDLCRPGLSGLQPWALAPRRWHPRQRSTTRRAEIPASSRGLVL